MKIFNKLIKIYKDFENKKILRNKLKIWLDLDKTSKYREAKFLDDKKIRRKK